MGYLSDYEYYSSGNECPSEYLYWGGLSLLGHVLGNKVWIKHGDYFRFYPNLFICLVGTAGSGKNTCLGVNIEIMIHHFPRLMLSASIQSREDIADLMSTDQCCMTWKDTKGFLGLPEKIYEYRPFYILNNELASFLSVDKMKMVEFLTEIFDGKRFSTGFKGQRRDNPEAKQWFENPHVSLLAGAVPTWFMGNLKLDLFSGGLGRRLIIVNAKRTKIIDDPRKPVGADAAMSRVIEHLKEAYTFYGEITRSDHAMLWWKEWYTKQKKSAPSDPILSQFHETKPMQVLKVALLLHLTERPFRHVMTADPLVAAAALLEKLENSIIHLTSGIGRNPLAQPTANIVDILIANSGMISEKKLLSIMGRDLQSREFAEAVNHLIQTDVIVKMNQVSSGLSRVVYVTKAKADELLKKKVDQNDTH